MAHAFRIEPTDRPRPRPRLTPVVAPPPCRGRRSRSARRGRRARRDHLVVAGLRVRRGAPYLRRRLAAALAVVVVAVGVWTLATTISAALELPASAGATDTASVADAAAPGPVSVVVRPGDTVWALAARLGDADADLRPVVDAIVDHLGTSMLTAGQRIELPASLGA